jgi:peptidoglycan/LPS O-acetylase OafA/YrhL
MKDQKEIKSLTGLRGIAILLVLLYHNFPYLRISKLGWVGVDLFFVLSGFLITRILLNAKTGRGYFLNFYMRRVLRIFPLYYAALLLFFIVEKLLRLPTDMVFSPHIAYYLTYTQNLLPFNVADFPARKILNHFWSLAVEEHFYILWPILVYWLRPKQLLIVGCITVILSKLIAVFMLSKGVSWMTVYMFSFVRFETLVLGSLLAVLFSLNKYQLDSIAKYSLISTGGVLAIFWSYILLKTKEFSSLTPELTVIEMGSVMLTVLALFFTALLYFAIKPGWFQRFLCSPKLMFLGKYSYGIYIFHYPLYAVISNYAFETFNVHTNIGKTILLIMPVVATAFAIVIAYFSYNYFENYFLKLKMRFSYNIPNSAAMASN